VRAAADLLADALNLPRKLVYGHALARKDRHDD
jgi:hypothetical protein